MSKEIKFLLFFFPRQREQFSHDEGKGMRAINNRESLEI